MATLENLGWTYSGNKSGHTPIIHILDFCLKYPRKVHQIEKMLATKGILVEKLPKVLKLMRNDGVLRLLSHGRHTAAGKTQERIWIHEYLRSQEYKHAWGYRSPEDALDDRLGLIHQSINN